MEEERRRWGGRGGSLTPFPLHLHCCQVLIPIKPQPHQRTPNQKHTLGQHPVGCESRYQPPTLCSRQFAQPTPRLSLQPIILSPKKHTAAGFYPSPPHLLVTTPAKDASSSCTAQGNPQPAACHPGWAPERFCIPTGSQPHQEFNYRGAWHTTPRKALKHRRASHLPLGSRRRH